MGFDCHHFQPTTGFSQQLRQQQRKIIGRFIYSETYLRKVHHEIPTKTRAFWLQHQQQRQQQEYQKSLIEVSGTLTWRISSPKMVDTGWMVPELQRLVFWISAAYSADSSESIENFYITYCYFSKRNRLVSFSGHNRIFTTAPTATAENHWSRCFIWDMHKKSWLQNCHENPCFWGSNSNNSDSSRSIKIRW